MRTYADDNPDKPTPRRPLRPSDQRLDPRRGLPRQPIYYTLDQVAAMLNLSYKDLCDSYVWFEGRDTGVYRRRYLRAVDFRRGSLEPDDHKVQDWRIPEGELLRWLTLHKLWIYDPGASDANFDYDRGAPFRRSLRDDDRGIRLVIDEAALAADQQMEEPHGG